MEIIVNGKKIHVDGDAADVVITGPDSNVITDSKDREVFLSAQWRLNVILRDYRDIPDEQVLVGTGYTYDNKRRPVAIGFTWGDLRDLARATADGHPDGLDMDLLADLVTDEGEPSG